MFGKVVLLTEIKLDNGFHVSYGIHNEVFQRTYRQRIGFADIAFANRGPQTSRIYIRGGHHISDKHDGVKEVLVFNGCLESNEKEEYLLVIIPHATYLKTNAKRIAGRYPEEAVLEMHVGDTVEVSKFATGHNLHTFMAIEAGNEMFLIEKTR